jgi:amino acid transporter
MSTSARTPAPGLVRGLGLAMATAVVVGTVIGSGIFKKPQVIATEIPYFGLAALAWVLGGVLALLGSLSISEVGILYPRAGGNYIFLREAYGRLAGFLWGWVEFCIIKGASLAALATIFTEALHGVLDDPAVRGAGGPRGFWEWEGLTVAVLMALAFVNVLGVRWGGGLQLVITVVKVSSLLAIMALPFVARYVAGSSIVPASPAVTNLEPVWPRGDFSFGAFAAALLGVLWAYHGWLNIAPVAGEIRRPQRNLPLALLGGIGIIIFVYLGAALAYALVIPADEMRQVSKDTTVVAVFGERLLGTIGGTAASAAVMCSVFGAINGLMLATPRLLYAMGEDGLAPRPLGAIHPRFHTPALAIVVMGVWASVLVIAVGALTRYGLPQWNVGDWTIDLNPPAGKGLFDVLTDFAMFGVVSFETPGVLSIFVFRRRFPRADRPYRCPGYPVVPALYGLVMGWVLVNMFLGENGRTEAVAAVGVIAVGAGVYALFADRKRSTVAITPDGAPE